MTTTTQHKTIVSIRTRRDSTHQEFHFYNFCFFVKLCSLCSLISDSRLKNSFECTSLYTNAMLSHSILFYWEFLTRVGVITEMFSTQKKKNQSKKKQQQQQQTRLLSSSTGFSGGDSDMYMKIYNIHNTCEVYTLLILF